MPLAFILLHLVALLALTATVWLTGRLPMRRLEVGGGWEGAGVAIALGLAVFGHLGLFLGLAGGLSRGPVLLAVAAVWVAAILTVWRHRWEIAWDTPVPRCPMGCPTAERSYLFDLLRLPASGSGAVG